MNKCFSLFFVAVVLSLSAIQADAQWKQLAVGQPGQVNAVTVVGSNVFAGTYAGIYKSTDGGESWTAIENGLGSYYNPVNGLAVDSSRLFAATGADVMLSTDDGDTWTDLVGNITADRDINCIAVHDSTVIVGSPDGIIRSTDDGRSWYYPSAWINTSATFSIAPDGSRIYLEPSIKGHNHDKPIPFLRRFNGSAYIYGSGDSC